MSHRRLLRRSTGIVAAPELPAGVRPSLLLFFSNHTRGEATVHYSVNILQPAESLTPVRSETLRLPVGAGATVQLPDVEIEGRQFEVSLLLPSPRVVPSAAIVQTAIADESTQLMLLFPPSTFTA